MAAEKALTVKGLQKEQAELLAAYKSSFKAFDKAKAKYKAAKDKHAEIKNGYGRVLEVLESAE